MQMVPDARHRHVEEPALLLDLLTAADRHIRRDAAIDDVQHEDGIPLLALGRVDRRQHEVVLVEMRRNRLGAGGLGRVQGQLGEKGAPGRIGPGDLLQLVEVGDARTGVVVEMLQMRLIPAADQRHLPCPGGRFTAKPGEQAAQLRPMRRGGGRCSETIKGSKVPAGSAQVCEYLPCGRRTDARQQLHDAERRYGVPGVLDPADQELLWIDPLDYADDLASGVQTLRAAGVNVSVYNLPLCVLDRSVWDLAVQSISDWKNAYLPVCSECSVRDRCSGFFSTGRPRTSRGIRPIRTQ